MIDWIKTAQGVAAIVAATFATMVAWWNLGLLRVVFSPDYQRCPGLRRAKSVPTDGYSCTHATRPV